MSSAQACPSCTQINPTTASVCLACGSALSSGANKGLPNPSDVVIDVTRLEADEDTVPAVHLDAPELQRWFDSRTDGPDSANAPFDLTLRSLDDLPVLDDVASDAEADALPPGVVLRSDGEPAPPPVGLPSVTKAARRAAVRRRRLSGNPSPLRTTAVAADVLVLEGDDPACEQLCGLLEVFGFRAHPVQTPVQALRMLDAKHFAAAFLNVLFDGPDQQANVDLCQRVKTRMPHTTDRLSALIVVSGSKRPVERVRATLAGSDAFLSKPVTRGSVAQALEACGVVLPTDSRRS